MPRIAKLSWCAKKGFSEQAGTITAFSSRADLIQYLFLLYHCTTRRRLEIESPWRRVRWIGRRRRARWIGSRRRARWIELPPPPTPSLPSVLRLRAGRRDNQKKRLRPLSDIVRRVLRLKLWPDETHVPAAQEKLALRQLGEANWISAEILDPSK